MGWLLVLAAATAHAAGWAALLYVLHARRAGQEAVVATWRIPALVAFLAGQAATGLFVLLWFVRSDGDPVVAQFLVGSALMIPVWAYAYRWFSRVNVDHQ